MVCAYDPVGYGIPYNYLLSSDQREQLVVHVIQVLIIALEHEGVARAILGGISPTAAVGQQEVRIRALICFTMATETTYIVLLHKNERKLKYCGFFFQPAEAENLFVNYLSRIHRDEVRRALMLVYLKDDPDASTLRFCLSLWN